LVILHAVCAIVLLVVVCRVVLLAEAFRCEPLHNAVSRYVTKEEVRYEEG
jgi:hypothetical protein